MKNLKRKLAVIACAAMLIVLAVGGSTIAYFTDTDSKTNVFTYGNVDVTLLENETTDPVNKSGFLPATDESVSEENNYVKKEVTVRNDGSTSAYIRTFIAVPSKLYKSGALHLIVGDYSERGWDLSGIYENNNVDSSSEDYVVIAYTYKTGIENSSKTSALLQWVYTDAKADVREIDGKQHVIMWNTAGDVSENNYEDTGYVLADNRQFNIYVNTQAVQADGFESPEDAFTAAFGNKDPWGASIEVQSGIPYPE